MKIIGLMPTKNEAWILKYTLPQLCRYVDEFVVLDDSDEDDSISIVHQYGGHVIKQRDLNTDYSNWRQTLLNYGRELNGTHFIWLDADESFSSNFLHNYKSHIHSMKSGQALSMEWICLWKSPYRHRFDNSVWVKNFKDFVFCDDQKSSFPGVLDHEPRTPVVTSINNLIKISSKIGCVLHFQFVPFKRFQAKQAYVQCREIVLWQRNPIDINKRYYITKDKTNIKTIKVPPDWLSTFQDLDPLTNVSDEYFIKKIIQYFHDYGVNKFEYLDIWDIDTLKEYFISIEGRQPEPQRYNPNFLDIKRNLLSSVKKFRDKYSDL